MNYSDMKATKTTKKKLDTNITISRKTTNKATRSLKKAGISFPLVIVFLLIGLLGGFFGIKYLFPNDTYEMLTYENGSADIYIGSGETYEVYEEKGVKCIAFGKDISNSCTVTYYYRDDLTHDPVQVDEVDETVAGIYYAVYRCDNIKFSSVKLIRNIIVLGEEDNG